MISVGGAPGIPSTAQSLVNPPCDYQTKGVNVLDLSTATFGSVYDANAAPYELPAKVVSVIGGK